MPPKKKKYFCNQYKKPGVVKQYLLDVFDELPADCDSILNGHVLHLYVVKCEKSLTVTERKLSTFIDQSSMSVLQRKWLSSHLKAKIKKLVSKTLNEFKCFSRLKPFQEFDSICRRSFRLTPPHDEDKPNFPNAPQPDEELTESVQQPDTTSLLDATQPVTDILVPVQPPLVKTRQLSKCDICKTRRKEMIAMHKKMLQLQRSIRILQTNTIVQARKYKSNSVKSLNQKLKCKEEQLPRVKKKPEKSPVVVALKTPHGNIQSSEKGNKRIKHYQKGKSLPFSSTNTDDNSMIEELHREKKKEEIDNLENEKSTLEDQVQEMEDSVCLQAAIDVLEKQYQKSSDSNITEQSRIETNSAQSHNIDSEQMMGMLSAAHRKAPAATLCHIAAKFQAQKNKTVKCLDSQDEDKQENIITKAVNFGKKQRKRKSRLKDLIVELSKRQADKQQGMDTTERNKLEKKLKSIRVDQIPNEFPLLNEDKLEDLRELLTGNATGREIVHIWYEDGKHVIYKGKLKTVFGNGKQKKYEVAYWDESSSFDDAADYEMPIFALAADLIVDDLIM